MSNLLPELPIDNATFEIRDWKTYGKTPKTDKWFSLGFQTKSPEIRTGGCTARRTELIKTAGYGYIGRILRDAFGAHELFGFNVLGPR